MQTETQGATAKTVIAFLGYREFDSAQAFRGAILVTDEWSKPIEFRCTAPVRPTHLQRTLYGESLLPHVLTELIAMPLLSSVREKPQLILIADDAYFDVRHKVSTPVIRVVGPGGSKSKQEERSKSKSLLIQSASGKFAQLEIEAHWTFGGDLDNCGDRLRDPLWPVGSCRTVQACRRRPAVRAR